MKWLLWRSFEKSPKDLKKWGVCAFLRPNRKNCGSYEKVLLSNVPLNIFFEHSAIKYSKEYPERPRDDSKTFESGSQFARKLQKTASGFMSFGGLLTLFYGRICPKKGFWGSFDNKTFCGSLKTRQKPHFMKIFGLFSKDHHRNLTIFKLEVVQTFPGAWTLSNWMHHFCGG